MNSTFAVRTATVAIVLIEATLSSADHGTHARPFEDHALLGIGFEWAPVESR